MKVLVTGSAGFIGGYAVDALLRRGCEVLALWRAHAPQRRDCPLELLECDLAADGEPRLDGRGIDVVVHLAASLSGNVQAQRASTLRGTANLLQAMQHAGIRRLVGVSSISVLDYRSALPMSVIDENSAPSRDEHAMGVYAATKARQEALFATFAAQPGNHCVVLRPGLVFDDTRLIGAHAGIMKGPVRLLVAHAGEVPVVSAQGVARAIVAAVDKKDIASGQVMHLVDDNLPDQPAYLAALRRRGLLPAGGMHASWRTMAAMATFAYRLAAAAGLQQELPEALRPQSFAARMKPFRYSNAKAKRLLGWVPDKQFC